jgi:hypothetical protein
MGDRRQRRVTTLFDARGHEPLADVAWRASEARDAIRAIARDADSALRGSDWWEWHPLDLEPDDPDVVHGVFIGAAGVLWALDHLARAGLHEPGHDYARLARDAYAGYLDRPEYDGPQPSVWMGEGGIALVAWLLAPARELGDRLAELVAEEPQPESLELMWGSPGLLTIADAMLERTGEPRWAEAWRAIAGRVVDRRGERVPGYWTQRLSGKEREILGPAHGLAGVVAALARRPELLPPGRLAASVTTVLAATAIRADGQANWPPSLQEALLEDDGSVRTQWCHGAPGIVASAAALPPDEQLDALLIAGGELTWSAGPLRKGAGLCHGTAGNGLAFLKLFTRTGDERWLERARRFAMHAARQVEAARRQYGRGRYTLWTGDLGTAVYLQRCLAATSEVPTIDGW